MAPRKRKFGFSTDDRLVYEALVELRDPAQHVISPGELFTQTKLKDDVRDGVHRDGFWPVCRECRPFTLPTPRQPVSMGPHAHPCSQEPHRHDGTAPAIGHSGVFAIAHSHEPASPEQYLEDVRRRGIA